MDLRWFRKSSTFHNCHHRQLPWSHEKCLQEVYPNLWVALRIALTLPVTVASAERSFSKLKLIKTYLRSTMGQERLSGLAVISINGEVAQKLSYDDLISDFAAKKCRRVPLQSLPKLVEMLDPYRIALWLSQKLCLWFILITFGQRRFCTLLECVFQLFYIAYCVYKVSKVVTFRPLNLCFI